MGSSLFGIGISGLSVAQRGLATTGHNIANADTPGYSRQRVELGTRPSQGTAAGFFGTGVGIQSVQRVFDGFLVDQIRTTMSASGELDRLHGLASQVDALLANPSSGISPALQEFFGATQALADDPSSIAARQVLLGEASTLVDRFHALDQQLRDMSRGVDTELSGIVNEINLFATQIGELNRQITFAEASAAGQPANDLRDRRDELLRELSGRVGISTFEQDDGAVNVTVGGGQALVVGSTVAQLQLVSNEFDPTRTEIAYSVSGTTAVISNLITSGELRGVLDFRDQVLDQGRDAIGRAAMGISALVNAQHRLGMDLDGQAGGDFFTALASSAPVVQPSANNTGSPAASLNVTVTDVGAVAASEYRLDRNGASHTLTRLSDNTVFNLTGFPGSPETVDGITLDLGAGTIADGDSFIIQPTRNGARDMGVALLGTRQTAAAAPVRTSASLSNAGSGVISAAVVNSAANAVDISFTSATTFDVHDRTSGATLATGQTYVAGNPISFNGWTVDITGVPANGDVFSVDRTVTGAASANTGTGVISIAGVSAPDPNLTDAVTVTFNSPPGTFTVTGSTTGNPTVNVPYTAGVPISYNGWTIQLSGTPAAGDSFTVDTNAGGVGDNSNMLLIGALQTADTLDSHSTTFGEAYGQLVAQVGTLTQQADVNRTAQQLLLDQAMDSRAGVSGVNLDEEAANLMRLQQSFEANARVISIANEIFDSLLAAVSS